jgi:hypothetical protein
MAWAGARTDGDAALHRAHPQGRRQVLQRVLPGCARRVHRRRHHRRSDRQGRRSPRITAKEWSTLDAKDFPAPRTIDELRCDPAFQELAADAVIAAVPFRKRAEAAA